MITIDGSYGEGGGQVLRTSLALSLVTGQPFKITNIRAGRKKSGLLRQHLTAVNAAVEIGAASVSGNEIRSGELTFKPTTVQPGSYRFAVGTAGSATLVLQTVLPALITADKPSELILEGGTHNPYAPPFDFLEKSFLPVIEKMGAKVTVELERPGFYPAGGGRFTAKVTPAKTLSQVDIMERGEIIRQKAVAIVSRLSPKIGKRELSIIKDKLSLTDSDLTVKEVKDAHGPGNALMVILESEHVTEVFTGFGERGVASEVVAKSVIKPVREYQASGMPVGRYLADQLMIPMALSGGGEFMTLPLTLHSTTNIEVIRKFMNVEVTVDIIDNKKQHVIIERK